MRTTQDNPPFPRIAAGVELVGRFEGSGFKEPPYLARRGDGQVIQLPELLYRVAEQCDGRRHCAGIAARVSRAFGRELAPGDVRFLLEEKLWPLGLLAAGDGPAPSVKKIDPLLALKFRAGIVPERVVHAVTTPFLALFWPPVVVSVIAGLAALDVWLFSIHGISTPTRELIYQPLLIVGLFALAALSAAFHEVGHATACRYGGARPGRIGAGLYIVWPAFYTDVTDAYRLDRWGRLRTDLGGVYFNAIFALGTAGAYFATGFEPLLVLVLLQHLEMLRQLLPLLRLDGYYVISDLTGVPDILSRIRPTLRSLIPWRVPDPRVAELKPWVRLATTGYLLMLIPAVAFVFAMMAMHAPRVFATAWDALTLEWAGVTAAFAGGALLSGVAGSLQILALALPPVGIALTGTRVASRLGRATWAVSASVPGLQAGLATTGATAVAFTGFLWWPNGDYRPIQPTERGTIQSAVASLPHVPTGRPALTAEHAHELDELSNPSDGQTPSRPPSPDVSEAPPGGAPAEPEPPADTDPEQEDSEPGQEELGEQPPPDEHQLYGDYPGTTETVPPDGTESDPTQTDTESDPTQTGGTSPQTTDPDPTTTP